MTLEVFCVNSTKTFEHDNARNAAPERHVTVEYRVVHVCLITG